MGTNRVHRDTEKVGDIPTSPIHAVDQEDGDALPFGEVGQSIGKTRFNLGDPRRSSNRHIMHRRRVELDAMPTHPDPATTHPIQISDRVRHLPNVTPMLPAVRQRFSGCVTATISPHRGDQRMTQSRFHHANELLERNSVELHGRHIRDLYLVEAQDTGKRHKNLPTHPPITGNMFG